VDFPQFIDETRRVKKQAARSLPLPSSSSDSSEPESEEPPPIINFPLILNPPWSENDIVTTYLFDRLFKFKWYGDSASPHAPVWTSILLCQDKEAELSTVSVRALATVYFAKVNGQHQLMCKGAFLYTHALRTLQTKLQRQDQAVGDDVLVAIICLAIYELITLTQPKAWLSHYDGLARLVSIEISWCDGVFDMLMPIQMALRGPHRHQSGISFAMIPTLRSCIVSQSPVVI
jgi:hypothetical protein